MLYAVSTALSLVILAPLLRPGHLLYRDAVSTPRTFVTDTTLGIDGLAPRAVPQDWVIAQASRFVDGGLVVVAIMLVAMILTGVGFGRLAMRCLPTAGRTGGAAAAMISIWNPFVAERLLQGHWSLLVSYAALGWVACAVTDIAANRRGWPALVAATALAGFTPTGSIAATIMLLVAVGPLVAARRLTTLGAMGAIAIVGALPWLTATIAAQPAVGGGTDGFVVFGARAEPWLGTPATLAGLGGIWNAEAVPASRSMGWAAVATAAFLLVVAFGATRWWRHRRDTDPTVAGWAVLALLTVVMISVVSITPIAQDLSSLSASVGGLGLFRDGQKFVMLAVPFVAIAAAAATTALRVWVPAGFAFGAAALLIVAPLPDLAWGVGGTIRPVTYPADWAAVARIIPDDTGSVAVWPPGVVRRYGFADGPSLNPLSRMVRAPVVTSGELTVDGVVVDRATDPGANVDAILRAGGDPAALADSGVGWVVVENDSPPTLLADHAHLRFRGDNLTLYRVAPPIAAHGADTSTRFWVQAAHAGWAGTIIVALIVGAAPGVRQRRRSSMSASKPSAVASQE